MPALIISLADSNKNALSIASQGVLLCGIPTGNVQQLSIPLRQPLLEPGALRLCSVAFTVAADGHVLAAGRKTV
ncbi:MAG TPA: hypothetical protein VEI57_13315 [Nitrospirota bacterium]|nr:hypothetical protein [Nitrospirota bacterium]